MPALRPTGSARRDRTDTRTQHESHAATQHYCAEKDAYSGTYYQPNSDACRKSLVHVSNPPPTLGLLPSNVRVERPPNTA